MKGKRNVLLIHMESLSLLTYRMNPELFPNLRSWESRSVSFSNYFSTATSTLMVMSDLAYGGLLRYESSRGLSWKETEFLYNDSFIDRFGKDDYRILVTECPTDSDTLSMMEKGFVGTKTPVETFVDYKEFEMRIEEFVGHESPFFLWDVNCICCSSCNHIVEDVEGQGIMTLQQRREESFRMMDAHVGKLLSFLEKNNILKNTSVIFYGDHGDDIYTHGNNGGLTHAIVPYLTATHTPFFIYDNRVGYGTNEKLICTTDIALLIEQLAHDQINKGIEVPDREYVISRSLFARQLNFFEEFRKGYAIFDGKYYLLVEEAGMSMFEIKSDPTGHHNILDYFDYDNGMLKLNEAYCSLFRYHFSCIFDRDTFSDITKSFIELRGKLLDEIKKLYGVAGRIDRMGEINSEEISYSEEAMIFRYKEITKPRSGRDRIRSLYLSGKKTVIYGAGKYGNRIYNEIKSITDIVAWVDRQYESIGMCGDGMIISSPETLSQLEFDIIIIAIKNTDMRQEVFDDLIKMGIPEELII